MNSAQIYLATCLAGVFVTMILYVLFGQVTVRKLRKNPETKDKLGVELVSGWDILNVAGALARPQWLSSRFKKSSFYFLSADTDVLKGCTTLFDQFLARLFWYFYIGTTISIAMLIILDTMGVFDWNK